MDTVELPAGEADHPVEAPAFPCFDDGERRKDADKGNMEAGEQGSVLRHLGAQHDVIDDEIVAFGRERRNGAMHATERALGDFAGRDGDRRRAGLANVLEHQAVGMIHIGFRQHVEKGVYGDVKERLGGDFLESPRDRALSDAADAIQDDDTSDHARSDSGFEARVEQIPRNR
jgi:hypothetical protein